MKIILLILYLVSYIILISLSLSSFYIFKSIKFIDNINSYLVCENGEKLDIGPNFIYSFSNKLDAFNDIKARKLCEYSMIRDYNNTLKTPTQKNYVFYPIYKTEYGIKNQISAMLFVLIIGHFVIELSTYLITGKSFLGNYILKSFENLIS